MNEFSFIECVNLDTQRSALIEELETCGISRFAAIGMVQAFENNVSRQNVKTIKAWTLTFGVGPTSEGVRSIVKEAADKIDPDKR